MGELPKITPENGQQEPTGIRRIESNELLRGEKQLVIRHAGEDYRLILTRNNRLILQK